MLVWSKTRFLGRLGYLKQGGPEPFHLGRSISGQESKFVAKNIKQLLQHKFRGDGHGARAGKTMESPFIALEAHGAH